MAKAAWVNISYWPELREIQESEFKFFTGPGTELSAEIKYLIAALVAQLNHSEYCDRRYRAALKSRSWTDEKITHILQDIRSQHLSAGDRAALIFAEKMTRHPQSMEAGDVDALRAAGLSERSILETAGVAGYFNARTRLVNALGLTEEDEELPSAGSVFG